MKRWQFLLWAMFVQIPALCVVAGIAMGGGWLLWPFVPLLMLWAAMCVMPPEVTS